MSSAVRKQLNGKFHGLLTHRKAVLTDLKRTGMRTKVVEEIKAKNPLRPTIARKSINLACKATDAEFRRSSKQSQKAHCTMLTRHSQRKENNKDKLRKDLKDN